ncbi:zinc fingers and homeoboxes protein 1-like isoform X2 [Boleophthalmus pectinirostris]|uniref:zinc fingers and homeoboxes protein 1-like isoform X2 n=1 Tax=Boleophthalmus pectinirostris TaxID=150288 RepID=UPI0024315B5A|nr:zinc fingers and homeoboxes protein 1-like isoform X2 [Boleophthalmus pectinirostris]
MSSRRKSTTPCMVLKQEAVESDQEDLCTANQSERSSARGGGATVRALDSDDDIMQADFFPVGGGASEGGYECKYCSFQTSDLNLFTSHVDTEHPHIVTNTSYECVECDYSTKSYDTLQAHNARCHPGEESFTRTMLTRNNQTVFQQSVNDLTFDGSFVKMEDGESESSAPPITMSHTPIMRQKVHGNKKFTKLLTHDIIKVESDSEEDYDSKEMPVLSPAPMTPVTPVTPVAPVAPRLVSVPPSLVVNGSSVLQVKGTGGASGMLAPGTLAQVLSALQGHTAPSAPQTQLLIPVSSIPSYSPAMDNNVLLIGAYNRFPYPSLSEILGLSSQTKFSEEQIKVWFSAQRLKHGVSWTPEEVEEARRKKFNGAVQAPPTITVIPASLASGGLQSLFQTCHIVGQPGLVLTQVPANANGNVLPVAPPLTLTVTGAVQNNQTGNQPPASEPAETQTKTEIASGLDQSPTKPKKSKEQLAELKASYSRRQFATEAEISRLMQVTKLSKRAIKKWFSDTRYNQRNSKDHHGLPPLETPLRAGSGPSSGPGSGPRSGSRIIEPGLSEGGSEPDCKPGLSGTIVIDSSDDTEGSPSSRETRASASRSPSDLRAKFRNAFPDFTLQKFKEKTPEQLMELEASFQKNPTPTDEELSRLRAQTKLTRREVNAWFTERRKLPSEEPDHRDHTPTEQAAEDCPSSPQQRASGGRRAVKKTLAQLHVLKKAFIRSQWPSPNEYERLAKETGLPRSHIVNWFGDTRYACKNSALKWYYLYQSGKVDEALNGGAKKKSRKRFRGWSRRRRAPSKRSTQDFRAVKVKSGVWFLKEYYLRHHGLSERDLDELVSKSGLSYERVRDWFNQVQTREQQGLQGFSEEEATTDEEEAEEEEEEEREEGEGGEEEAAEAEEMDELSEEAERGEEEGMEEEEEGEDDDEEEGEEGERGKEEDSEGEMELQEHETQEGGNSQSQTEEEQGSQSQTEEEQGSQSQTEEEQGSQSQTEEEQGSQSQTEKRQSSSQSQPVTEEQT